MRLKLMVGPVLAIALLIAESAQAEIVVSGNVLLASPGSSYAPNNFPDGQYNNLTTLGASDWAYFTGIGNPSIANSKLGGDLIGTPTFADPNRRGQIYSQTGGNATTTFNFSDGTSRSAATNVNAGVTGTRGGSNTFSNDPGPSFRSCFKT